MKYLHGKLKKNSKVQELEPRLKLDVGGTHFTTSLTTLKRFPDSMIGSMFSGRHALILDKEEFYFIDRDGTHFRHILNFLRNPEKFQLNLSGEHRIELIGEVKYYGLEDVMFPFKKTEDVGGGGGGGRRRGGGGERGGRGRYIYNINRN